MSERAPREITVLVLEPHEIARTGLHSMLDSLPFVAEVRSSGSTAINRELLQGADVVLISADIAGAAMNTLETSGGRPSHTLLLIRSSDRAALDAAARYAVDGYLMEPEITMKSLSDALVSISCGKTPMPAALADHLLHQARNRQSSPPSAVLTPRERGVLALLVHGHTNKEIAVELSISPHGVKRHVANLLAKMHAPNRTHAVATALSEGLLAGEVD